VGSWADRPPVAGVSEATARCARQDFFAAALREHGARVLWLGHQLDDVAETFFMRLARGSGTGGLAAPRPVQNLPGGRVNLRPLLGLTKVEIQAVLRGAGVPWREDASNTAARHLRNRLRGEVLPAWLRAVQDRDALTGAGLARDRLEEDDEALESWVERVGALPSCGVLELTTLASLPVAVWRRALRRWLGESGLETDLSRVGFEALLAAVQTRPRGRFSLGREGFAVWKSGRLLRDMRPK
jgi:tRNA(Ile)-lysidine synthase